MKQIRSLISVLVACGVGMAMVTNLAAQTTQQGIAKVVSIKGSARYMVGTTATWQPLKVGTTLKPGAIIQTASGSYVDIVLNNPEASGAVATPMSLNTSAEAGLTAGVAHRPKARQDAIRVFENTILGVDKLTLDQTGVETITDTQLDLKAGSIFFTVKKLSAGSKYEVKIPNGVAGVRGSAIWLSAIGLARCFEGQLVLAFSDKSGAIVTKIINAGRQFDIRSGEESFVGPQLLGQYQQWMKEFPTGGFASMNYARDYTFIPVSAVK